MMDEVDEVYIHKPNSQFEVRIYGTGRTCELCYIKSSLKQG